MLAAVIMAGGKGTRFWPRSTESLPKQLIQITGEKTMIEETLDRLAGIVPLEQTFISTRADLLPAFHSVIPRFPEENYIIEPMGRDTAAAVGLAAMYMRHRCPGAVLLMLPADQSIHPTSVFQHDALAASHLAKETGCLITFGIQPSRPETGYGYIQRGEIIQQKDTVIAYEVRRFTEKPDEDTAQEFVLSGDYLWNSGMFVWTTEAILSAIETHMPDLYDGLAQISERIDTPREQETLMRVFEGLKKISVDYGIMEKATNTLCVAANFKWDDVGSWSSLKRIRKSDHEGNIKGGAVTFMDSFNNIVLNDEGIISLVGVKDLVIIKHNGAVLITNQENEQKVKKLVGQLKESAEFKEWVK